jgi:arylsulfatase A-like enzyme
MNTDVHSALSNRHGADRRPNVIWILADQLRACSFGYRGDPNVRTPNIDNLARRGVRFDSAVAGSPWCSPFRAAMLTSTYPHQNGVTRTPSPLDPALPTVAVPFRDAGYHTAWIGKWHVDGSNGGDHIVPRERRGGFDYWRGYENNNAQEESYVYGGYTDAAHPRYNAEDEKPVRLPGYETDSLTDLCIEHLREHVRSGAAAGDYQPFFAALSVQPPHSPYVGPGSGDSDARGPHWPPITPSQVTLRPNVPHVDRIREQARLDYSGYAAMVENLDWNVGRVLAALRDLDADRETWVMFFSDHGDMLGSHGQWEKSSPWEESVRIPFIVARVAGHQAMATGVCDALVNHVDIAPTTLGLCGVTVPEWAAGYDYSARCKRDGPAGDAAAGEPTSAYLQQIPRKYHAHSVNKAWRAVVTRDGWKYVCTPGNDWLLHNLNEDQYEQANLCYDSVYQAQKERCHAELARWIEETGDEFVMPEIGLRRG